MVGQPDTGPHEACYRRLTACGYSLRADVVPAAAVISQRVLQFLAFQIVPGVPYLGV